MPKHQKLSENNYGRYEFVKKNRFQVNNAIIFYLHVKMQAAFKHKKEIN